MRLIEIVREGGKVKKSYEVDIPFNSALKLLDE